MITASPRCRFWTRFLVLCVVGIGVPSVVTILLQNRKNELAYGVEDWLTRFGEMRSFLPAFNSSSVSVADTPNDELSVSDKFPLLSSSTAFNDFEFCANSKRIIAQDPAGSCYGDCFSVGTVGPDTGCPCSCDFIKAAADSDSDRQADAVVRFFHTQWDGNVASVRRPQQRIDQQLIIYIGESSAQYRSLQMSNYMHLYNYSIGWRRHGVDTLTPEPGVFIKALLDGVAEQQKAGISPPVSFEAKTRNDMMSVWISNCGMIHNGRNRILEMISTNRITLASYGSCGRNAEIPTRIDECGALKSCANWTAIGVFPTGARRYMQKVHTVAQHMFMFAAENSDCDWYHTEKVHHALLAGSIPVYVGAPTIVNVVPSESIIEVRKFASAGALADHMHSIMTNQTLYEQYHAWRNRALDRHIAEILREENRRRKGGFDCDLCVRISARALSSVRPYTECHPPHQLRP